MSTARYRDPAAPVRDWTAESVALFGRHIALTPTIVRHGRGTVRCPFHQDRRPSLAVDLARGRWRCWGACHQHGGLRDFAEKVGESWASPRGGSAVVTEEDLIRQATAWRTTRARHNAAVWALDDVVRTGHRWAARVRAVARHDDELTWDVLARAADMERYTAIIEEDLDRCLAAARDHRALGAMLRIEAAQ